MASGALRVGSSGAVRKMGKGFVFQAGDDEGAFPVVKMPVGRGGIRNHGALNGAESGGEDGHPLAVCLVSCLRDASVMGFSIAQDDEGVIPLSGLVELLDRESHGSGEV